MSDVTSQILLYDSDILAIENVYRYLQQMQRKVVNLDAFVQEVRERFWLAGFKVDVKTFDTSQDGLFAFDIEINDRVDSQPWDPDRMVHEVTNDLLELGEGGVIKSDPILMAEAAKKKPHRH